MQALWPPRGGRVKITQPKPKSNTLIISILIELRADISYSLAYIVMHGALPKIAHVPKIRARFQLDHNIHPPLGCRQPILYVHWHGSARQNSLYLLYSTDGFLRISRELYLTDSYMYKKQLFKIMPLIIYLKIIEFGEDIVFLFFQFLSGLYFR